MLRTAFNIYSKVCQHGSTRAGLASAAPATAGGRRCRRCCRQACLAYGSKRVAKGCAHTGSRCTVKPPFSAPPPPPPPPRQVGKHSDALRMALKAGSRELAEAAFAACAGDPFHQKQVGAWCLLRGGGVCGWHAVHAGLFWPER